MWGTPGPLQWAVEPTPKEHSAAPAVHSGDFTMRRTPMTKPIPGATTKPSEVPREAGGGSNARGTGKTQGKDGNGAQKRKQEKRT
jgi:hypothetical protein